MKFAELERQFVKISQKYRFPDVFLGCRLEVQRSPRLIFVQSGAIYRWIWSWRAPTAGDALSCSPQRWREDQHPEAAMFSVLF
jgi:hypothetical protein